MTYRDRWEGFVEDNGGPVFDSWAWGALCEACGHRTYRYAVEEDGELFACVPLVYMESRLFGDKLGSMHYSAYGSVVSQEDAPEEAIHLLLEPVRDLADELGVDFVSLRGRDLGNPPGFERKNRFVTFDIPLSDDPEEVWDALDGSNRTHVHKARKEGVAYRRETSREDLKRYYDLYLKNMRAFGSPPHSFSFFTWLWEDLGEHMVVELALKDDRLINGQIRFLYGDQCFDWGGVTDYTSTATCRAGASSCGTASRTPARRATRRTRWDGPVRGPASTTSRRAGAARRCGSTTTTTSRADRRSFRTLNDVKYDRVKDVWERLPLPLTRVIDPPIRRQISL